MPNVTSSLGTSNEAIPAVNSGQIGKFRGLFMHYPNLTTLNSVSATAKSLWAEGQPLTIAGEPAGVYRAWNSTARHARTAVLPSGATVVLAADANVVLSTTGVPAGGVGAVDDAAVDVAGNAYYTKTGASAWSAPTAIFPGGGASAVGAAVAVPFSTVIPLDGTKIMQPIMAAGPLTFTLQAEASRVPGASCLIKIVAKNESLGALDGGPTITGAFVAANSAGWDSTTGRTNNILVTWDGSEAYYTTAYSPDEPDQTTFGVTSVSGSTITVSLGGGGVAAGTMPAPSAFTISTLAGGTTSVADTVTAVTRASATSLQLTKSRTVVAGDVTSLSYTPPAVAPLLNAVTNKRAFGIPPVRVGNMSVGGYLLDLLGAAAGNGVAYSTRRLRAAYNGPALQLRQTDAADTPVGADFNVPFAAGSQELSLTSDPRMAAGGTGLPVGHKLWVMRWYNQMPSGTAFDATTVFGLQTSRLIWNATLSKWVLTGIDNINPSFKLSPAGLAAQLFSSTLSGVARQYTQYVSAKPAATQVASSVFLCNANPEDGQNGSTYLTAVLGGTATTRIVNGGTVSGAGGLYADLNLATPTSGPIHVVASVGASSASLKINGDPAVVDSTLTLPIAPAADGLAVFGNYSGGGYQGVVGDCYEFIGLPFAVTNINRDLIISNATAYWG